MDIEHRQVDGVTVVQLAGRLDSAVSGEVMDQLNAIVESGATRLVLNLRDVTYVSSAGLRSILVAAKLIKSANGEMRLCEPTGLVAKILDTSGFAFLIKTDSSEDQSVEALRGSAAPKV